MSRYCTDIGTDIGKKPDIGPDIGNIGFGKERVCRTMSRYCTDIGADIANIGSDIGKNDTISCLDDTISENAKSGHTLILVQVLSRYRGRYRAMIYRLVLNLFSR